MCAEFSEQEIPPQNQFVREAINISKHKPAYISTLSKLYLGLENNEIGRDTIDLFKEEFNNWVFARFSQYSSVKSNNLSSDILSEEETEKIASVIRESELEDPVEWTHSFNQYLSKQISEQPTDDNKNEMRKSYQKLNNFITTPSSKVTT
jgi:predicted O-linked N-acetylglucosamine transferase (SPINDLY family)